MSAHAPKAPAAGFLVRKQPWVLSAACVGEPLSLFFDATRVVEARAMCRGCPVRAACLEQAMLEEGNAPYKRYGMRGGKTAAQRATLHARTKQQSRGDSRD